MIHDSIAFQFLVGFVLLIGGADLLVRGASRLASALGVSPLVVGLIVVGFGTSAPEVAVSVGAVLAGSGDIALGNVVGSNIANVLLVLGIAAALSPLAVERRVARWDVPLVIAASLLLAVLALDGAVGRGDAALLLALLAAWIVHTVRSSRRDLAAARSALPAPAGAAREPRRIPWNLGLVAVGLGMLVLGSDFLVGAATAMARALGVGPLVIGLTIVAVGTSLPEIATSVVAAFRGERDIAVGNILGSNLFNILCVLGLAGLADPGGVPVDPRALSLDLPVMIGAALVCLPLFLSGSRVSRLEGLLLLLAYAGYTAVLVLEARAVAAADPLRGGLLLLPLLPLLPAAGRGRRGSTGRR